MKKFICPHCGDEFYSSVELDGLGWHTSCPYCGGSFDVDANYFGVIKWCNDDIWDAFAYHCYDFTGEDIDDVRAVLEGDAFREHMIAAGWDFIYEVVHNHMREKEAIDHRAKEELN